MSPEAPAAEVKRPPWKNPFVPAFVLGVVVLTVLPFLQGRFLKAPPPLMQLASWQLALVSDAGAVGSTSLGGHVVLLELAPSPCDTTCVERQDAFGKALAHTDDLGDAVHLVTVVMPGAEASLSTRGDTRWHVASGDEAQVGALLGVLREGWANWAHTDAGSSDAEFSQLPAVVLIDQLNQLRGFWRDDPAGRGNAINAARLLARHPEVTTLKL